MHEPIPMTRDVALALKEGNIITDSSGARWECYSSATPCDGPAILAHTAPFALAHLYFVDDPSHRGVYQIAEASDHSNFEDGAVIFIALNEGCIDMDLSNPGVTVTKAA